MVYSQTLKGLNPVERHLILLSMIGIILCLYILRFSDLSGNGLTFKEKEIGNIAKAERDIRIKNYSQSLWMAAKSLQAIREGDKIYTGEKSSALLRLKNESTIELRENSLVEFKKLNREQVADLSEGQYKVAITKNLKVAINGKITKISGDAEVVLTIDKNKNLSVKTLKGTPTIQYQNKIFKPTTAAIVDIPQEAPPQMTKYSAKMPIRVESETKSQDYYLKLYDLYDKNGNELHKRSSPLQIVKLNVDLPIQSFDTDFPFTVEHASSSDLNSPQTFEMDSLHRTLYRVYVGDNYWRCKQPETEWTKTAHFFVRTLFLPNAKPTISTSAHLLYLETGAAETKIKIQSSIEDINGYVVESSIDESFQGKNKIHWTYQDTLNLTFHKPGNYYYRFRAVNKDMKLSEWSETEKIEVLDMPALATPQFARQEYVTTTGESLLLSWSSPDSYKHYQLKIYDRNNNEVMETTSKDSFYRWRPKSPGDYYAEVRTVDSRRRVSAPGRAMVFVKNMIIKIVENLKKKEDISENEEEQEEERQPASEDMEIVTQNTVEKRGYNIDFALSNITVGTSFYEFNSKVLAESSLAPEATPGIYVDAVKWIGQHGAQGVLQKNFGGSNPAASTDFYSLELRYHYRLAPSQDSQSLQRFHLSPFLGYELYDNQNPTNFLSDYNMLKFGALVQIPIMQNWLIGVLGSYGTGNSLTKYDATWDLSYFFRKQWTMGFAYKINLLQGSTTQFPSYPDYREGFSLGQFNLKYFF